MCRLTPIFSLTATNGERMARSYTWTGIQHWLRMHEITYGKDRPVTITADRAWMERMVHDLDLGGDHELDTPTDAFYLHLRDNLELAVGAGDHSIQNDGIGPYECGGAKGWDHGDTICEIDNLVVTADTRVPDSVCQFWTWFVNHAWDLELLDVYVIDATGDSDYY